MSAPDPLMVAPPPRPLTLDEWARLGPAQQASIRHCPEELRKQRVARIGGGTSVGRRRDGKPWIEWNGWRWTYG